MDMFDAFHLARFQFAFTVAVHIIFPAISIGLAMAPPYELAALLQRADTLFIAVAQLNPTVGDVSGNLELARRTRRDGRPAIEDPQVREQLVRFLGSPGKVSLRGAE